jgi:hypothetical protein
MESSHVENRSLSPSPYKDTNPLQSPTDPKAHSQKIQCPGYTNWRERKAFLLAKEEEERALLTKLFLLSRGRGWDKEGGRLIEEECAVFLGIDRDLLRTPACSS